MNKENNRICSESKRRPLHPVLKVRICGENVVFGPGIAQLMRFIDSTGSVRLACEKMEMSYSKGWKILAAAEQELGYAIVFRQQGGKHGGAARLTPAGRLLLDNFTSYERECKEVAQRLFQKYFPE